MTPSASQCISFDLLQDELLKNAVKTVSIGALRPAACAESVYRQFLALEVSVVQPNLKRVLVAQTKLTASLPWCRSMHFGDLLAQAEHGDPQRNSGQR